MTDTEFNLQCKAHQDTFRKQDDLTSFSSSIFKPKYPKYPNTPKKKKYLPHARQSPNQIKHLFSFSSYNNQWQ